MTTEQQDMADAVSDAMDRMKHARDMLASLEDQVGRAEGEVRAARQHLEEVTARARKSGDAL